MQCKSSSPVRDCFLEVHDQFADAAGMKQKRTAVAYNEKGKCVKNI